VSIGRFSICSALLDEALFGLAALVDWRAELVRNAAAERLCIHVEQSPGGRLEEEDIRRALLSVDAIHRSLQSGILAAIDVKVLPAGGLVRGTRAKKLILDGR
jgi:hypothetical protein